MLTIIRAAQEFENPALILYGAVYQDKTVATKIVSGLTLTQVCITKC